MVPLYTTSNASYGPKIKIQSELDFLCKKVCIGIYDENEFWSEWCLDGNGERIHLSLGESLEFWRLGMGAAPRLLEDEDNNPLNDGGFFRFEHENETFILKPQDKTYKQEHDKRPAAIEFWRIHSLYLDNLEKPSYSPGDSERRKRLKAGVEDCRKQIKLQLKPDQKPGQEPKQKPQGFLEDWLPLMKVLSLNEKRAEVVEQNADIERSPDADSDLSSNPEDVERQASPTPAPGNTLGGLVRTVSQNILSGMGIGLSRTSSPVKTLGPDDSEQDSFVNESQSWPPSLPHGLGIRPQQTGKKSGSSSSG